jgi:signal transduction histidine kinase
MRRTIRVRLTLLYAGAFFLAGAALILFTYLYLRQSLDHQLTTRIDNTEKVTSEFLREGATHTRLSELHEVFRAEFQRDRDATLHTMLVWSLVALAVVGGIAAAHGWILAGRVLRPLQQITATARRVADSSLHERIALKGPDDEIKDLADTFDGMLERLDRSFGSQRRFVANASHELRTPLTINRTLIQVALDAPNAPEPTRKLGVALLEVNQRHERLIDGLLVLASSDRHLTELVPVDLADVTRSALPHDTGVTLRTTLSPAPVLGDPVLLERLAHNLIDNSIRYNTDHGWVTVTTGVADSHAYLIVENTGPIVPGDEVDSLFEPFRRLPSVSSGRGAGLGLSIVDSVARAHDGDVRAHARRDGGLAVHVRIPCAHTLKSL